MFYVYAYLDPRESLSISVDDISFEYRPIYIGKGSGNRMNTHISLSKRLNSYFYNKLNKMLRENTSPIIIKVREFEDEHKSLEFESQLVEKLGKIIDGGLLYNISDGGFSNKGSVFSKETKQRMSVYAIENKSHLNFGHRCGENHPMYGKKHTKESLDKISKSKLGKKQSIDCITKRVSKLRGKKRSQSAINKTADFNRGRSFTEEHKSKISKSKLGKEPHNKGKIKDIIIQLDFNLNVIREYYNLDEIEAFGFQKSNVINTCSGKRKSHGGFYWKYKNT